MSQLPPFAIGPHYLLSMDCAEFIHKNKDDLAGVGTLEDVSVALWLLALQVHPQHSEQFTNARLFGCEAYSGLHRRPYVEGHPGDPREPKERARCVRGARSSRGSRRRGSSCRRPTLFMRCPWGSTG